MEYIKYKNPNSNIRYVINESRFNASQLCKMKKGIKQNVGWVAPWGWW